MSLGIKFHRIKKKQNLSQEQLAEKVWCARQTISKWELGETAPDIKQAQMLSQIFNVSMDGLLGKDTMESINITHDCKEKNSLPLRKIIVVSAAVLFMCLVIVSVFDVVKRSQILHPEGVEGNVIITRKDPIVIGKGSTETIVFSEKNKPTIVCELPEGFVADAERTGFYTDGDGNFIKFNADYSDNVVNPLFGTDYYSYYENDGYHSYMDMANAAMYNDLPKLGIFSSIEELHLAGGAQLIRRTVMRRTRCSHYYAIDGGLQKTGNNAALWNLRFPLTIPLG